MDNECLRHGQPQKGISVINTGLPHDLSGELQPTNTALHGLFDDESYHEDTGKAATHSSMFLQTLNLKSKDMSDHYNLSHPEACNISASSASHVYEQVPSKTFLDAPSTLQGFICSTDMTQEEGDATTQGPHYPNFLMDDKKMLTDDFKSEPVTYTESESQSSLGKTLATSLHLIAATDVQSLPPVESPLPDSVGIDDLRPSALEPTGRNSIDSVTSTTIETDSTPLTNRYRTRSISVNEKTAVPKQESMLQADSDRETKEERISSTEDEPFYRCDQCGKVFHKKQTLRQHFITHTDRFACAFCNVCCKSKGDLRSHTQTHTKEKPFHCEVCNTYYTRESILKKHKTTQLHKNACLKAEKMQSILRQSRKSLSDPDFEMDENNKQRKNKQAYGGYSKVSSSRKDLQKHSKTHNSSSTCSKCHKKCKNAALLKVHERCHFKPSALSCRLCSRSFSSAAILKDHLKSHYRQGSHYLRIGRKSFRPTKEAPVHSATESNDSIKQKSPTSCPEKKCKKPKEILFCQTCPRRFKSPKAFEKHCAKHLNLPELTLKEENKTSENLPAKEDCNDETVHCCVDCAVTFDSLESLKTHRAEVHNMQTMACHICYRVFEDSSEFKNHVQNHAPTMLFSGESLDDSTINVTSKKSTKRYISHRVETSDTSGQEVKVPSHKKTSSNVKIQNKEYSDEENSLNCYEFIRLLRTAVAESSDEGATGDEDEDGESCDEQLFRGLQNLLCVDMDNSGDLNQTSSCSTPRSQFQDHSSIEYQSFVDTNSIHDFENNIFKCIPCSACFKENGQLTDHMKTHVCDICFEFFIDKKTLLEHKSHHESNQRKEQSHRNIEFTQIDDASSTSEDEANDLFLDELESILDCETKTTPQIDLLHTFTHDEIVKANKKTFERYSCIDIPTNIYACTICKRKYARPTTLTRHFKTHVCHYCNKFFIDKSDLLEHKYKHRQKAALLKAEISGEQSIKILNSPVVSKVNRELFKKFTFIDSSRNLNKCCLCDKTFVRKTVLTRHMKTHICSYCDKFYEDKYELARHVGMHKIDARVSEDSGETREYNDFDDEKPYAARSTIPNHLEADGKVVTLGPSFSSSLPHFSSAFANPGGAGHETLTFIEIPVTNNCESTSNVAFGDSNETVTSTYQIISDSIEAFKQSAHESFIVDGSGCQPDDSNKIITIAQSQIMAADGNQDRLNLFECTLCGKTFFKSGHLKSHMSTHTVNKPHVCHLCGKSFVRRGALKRHEKGHDIKRCKFCDTSFNYQFELDDHMQMHESYSFYK